MTKLSDNYGKNENTNNFMALCASIINLYYGINDGYEVMLIPLKDGGLAITVTDKQGNELIKSKVECSKEEADDCMFKTLEDAISDYEFDCQVECRSREINNISEHSSQLDFSKIVNKSNSSRDTQNITLSFVHQNFKLSFYQPKGLTEKEELTEQGIPTTRIELPEKVNKLLELHRSIAEAKSKVSKEGRRYTYIA